MDLGISGRVALVLGGSKGLAYSTARHLAAAGVRVVLNGRDAEAGAAAAAGLGHGAFFVQGDVSQPGVTARVIAEAQARAGQISILVTNAGGPPTGRFTDHDTETWRHALETNMLSAISATQMLLPDMIADGFGRIVNITSFAVKEPYPNMALANSVRAGLTGAMATLARETVAQGVTVNNVLPGLMATGALDRVIRAKAKREGITETEAAAAMAGSVPAQRLGTAEDFGPIAAFLCSVHAGYITGQNIAVDGGLTRGLL
ncbi:SDR family oxidoreductase [Rhodobacter sp. 24-YEA-8]|uniref:SDR family oxidoreductase n=1 Tax=Rhodobacter sp. 24-YEA-8 TaxID=1884310 RepID=UPI0008980E9E|nr:SDR family oxidoreductase [Rhodobacter sp. 24-YEA-8]SED84248.1 3-oxoacyl-[acyl-carrier protein] reductase [Rhodobacter sp. 24-YEA-8]